MPYESEWYAYPCFEVDRPRPLVRMHQGCSGGSVRLASPQLTIRDSGESRLPNIKV